VLKVPIGPNRTSFADGPSALMGPRPRRQSGGMTNNKQIVVGYDGSALADLALEWAAATARLEFASVLAVSVDHADDDPWSTQVPESDLEHGPRVELILKEAGAQGSSERRSGHILPVLLDVARDARMLVVGSHGHGSVGEALLGSVSQHVARHADCPVVVVRPVRSAVDKIIVGVDGSPGSENALEFACRRAELTGEVVVALHGWQELNVLVDRKGNVPDSIARDLEERGLLLAEAVAGVSATHPDVVLIQEPIPVSPGRALVDASVGASLVVVGSRGRGAFAGMLLGSVSNDVLAHAHCPVAVVR